MVHGDLQNRSAACPFAMGQVPDAEEDEAFATRVISSHRLQLQIMFSGSYGPLDHHHCRPHPFAPKS